MAVSWGARVSESQGTGPTSPSAVTTSPDLGANPLVACVAAHVGANGSIVNVNVGWKRRAAHLKSSAAICDRLICLQGVHLFSLHTLHV